MRRAAPLRPHLHDALVLTRRRHHRLAFGHIHADGLLTVHVGPGLHGFNHGQSVPVIRRRNQANIQTALLQHVAIVVENLRLFPGLLPRRHNIRRLRQHLRIHIAERNHLHGLNLDEPQQIDLAVPSGADQADPPRSPSGLGVRRGARGQRACQKGSAIHAPEYIPAFPANRVTFRAYLRNYRQGCSRSPNRERTLKPDVARRTSHVHRISARHNPGMMQRIVPDRQGILTQRQRHRLFLTRFQPHLFKSLELSRWLSGRRRISQIKLHHLGSIPRARCSQP